jgi:hypothetical protein
MARRKRGSVVLEKAEQRLAGLMSINQSLDLGSDLTVDAYSELILSLREQLLTYNQALATIDYTQDLVKELEGQVGTLSEKMLLGVAAKYGKDSAEYGKAGGVRRSSRRRRTKVVTMVADSVA